MHGSYRPSRKHSNVEPVSLLANVNVAVESIVSSGGKPVIVVTGGPSTVHVYDAGVGSWLPEASTARTRNVCDPAVSSRRFVGDSQSAKAAPSSEQSNVEPIWVDVNANVACGLRVVAGGCSVIVVSGAVVSTGPVTVHVNDAGGSSTRPNSFVAATSNVNVVDGPHRSVSVSGDAHGVTAQPLRVQAYVTGDWSDDQANVAEVEAVLTGGVVENVVTGGPTTVHDAVAGVESVLPRVSTARTRSVCSPGASPVWSAGDLHVANAAPSSEHSNTSVNGGTTASGSVGGAGVALSVPGEGHRGRRLGQDPQRRAGRDRGLRLDVCRARGSTCRPPASGRAGRRDRCRRRRARRTCANRGARPAGPASSRTLSGLVQSTNSTGFVVSRPHSNVSTPGGVRSSVPWSSNISSLVRLPGATVMVVFGGSLTSGGRTSHSYSAASSASPSVGLVANTRNRCSPGMRPV